MRSRVEFFRHGISPSLAADASPVAAAWLIGNWPPEYRAERVRSTMTREAGVVVDNGASRVRFRRQSGCHSVEIYHVADRYPVRTVKAGYLKVMNRTIVGRRVTDLYSIQEQRRPLGLEPTHRVRSRPSSHVGRGFCISRDPTIWCSNTQSARMRSKMKKHTGRVNSVSSPPASACGVQSRIVRFDR
jgi:hypothetical protein